MGRLAKAFESRMEQVLDTKIGRALAQFDGASACAGITDDPENQRKARINHYGGTIRKTQAVKRQFSHLESVQVGVIPERHFIDHALEDVGSLRDFEEEVAKAISGGKGRTYDGWNKTTGQTTFAEGRRGVERVLLKIANEMANNQIQALLMVQPENADSTAKRKGFNEPLVEEGKLVGSIRHWVEGV